MKTLWIESSCDETAVALLDDGIILTSKVYSQTEHSRFGGVVPEVAARAHLEKIEALAGAVFSESGAGMDAVDLIAVTDSPGLAGALLVGKFRARTSRAQKDTGDRHQPSGRTYLRHFPFAPGDRTPLSVACRFRRTHGHLPR